MSSTNTSITGGGTGCRLHGVPKLNGKSNYLRWSLALKLYFKKEKTWHIIEGTAPKTAATITTRKKKDNPNASKATTKVESPQLFTYTLSVKVIADQKVFHTCIEDEEWIINSGAGYHFMGCRNALSDFVKSVAKIKIADNCTVISPGYSSAVLKNGSGNYVKLSKVLYLPGAVNGLLSVNAISKHGTDVTLKAKDKTGVVNGKVIIRSRGQGMS
ncbi:hypothetical protein JCM3770_000002 [Rhodotorula araucariae]